MLLKLTALESQDRYENVYRDNPPKSVWVFTRRLECGKNNKFLGASAICYAWFVWDKSYSGATTVGWINTGDDKKYEQLSIL